MKFFSYSNKNNGSTKAASLENLRAVEVYENMGKSEIRFGVRLTYRDNTAEVFNWLDREEAKAVHKQIVDALNS